MHSVQGGRIQCASLLDELWTLKTEPVKII